MDYTVWYSRMHLAADDVANLVTKDQSALGLQLSKELAYVVFVAKLDLNCE